MSDPRPTLAERIAACCPCRKRYKCGGYSDHVCCGPYEQPCRCEEPATETARECTSTVHELAAEVAELEKELFGQHTLAQEWQGRTEAAEALLDEAPEPTLTEWETEGSCRAFRNLYLTWLARVRAAGRKA